jgi:hypothetical protein
MRARDNPFRVERLGRLAYRLEATRWDELLARLAALDHRAALVGPEGRGKSTLLAELGERLARERGLRLRAVTLRRGERKLDRAARRRLLGGLDARDLLLVDGAQELSAWEWRWILWGSRAAAGLVVTSHRAGLLPTLLECRTTPALLAELIAELASDGAGLPPADELFARHAGNLRDALLDAFDRCAAFGGPDPLLVGGDRARDVPHDPLVEPRALSHARLAGVHLAHAVGDLRVAAGELADQLLPALDERT